MTGTATTRPWVTGVPGGTEASSVTYSMPLFLSSVIDVGLFRQLAMTAGGPAGVSKRIRRPGEPKKGPAAQTGERDFEEAFVKLAFRAAQVHP